MAKFGGNEFTSFSIPLVFEGRYFILEPGIPPLLSVFTERAGEASFEVVKNLPVDNPTTEASTNETGVVTVVDRISKRFLYKIRPDSETSVAFGKLGGKEIEARITDRFIQVGGLTLQNNTFHGQMAGVIVEADGRVNIGAPIPTLVQQLLRGQADVSDQTANRRDGQ